MTVVGFDAITLKRPPIIPGSRLQDRGNSSSSEGRTGFKAMIGASTQASNWETYWSAYDSVLNDIFQNQRIRRLKPVYKAAHLAAQFQSDSIPIIKTLLERLAPLIERIDVYSAYYNREFVSCYGETRGIRLTPSDFIDKNENAFPHICLWKFMRNYSYDSESHFLVDHFEGHITPAWREIQKSGVRTEILYSGGECDPLISTSDIILRLIDTYQRGTVNGPSLLDPIRNNVPALESKLKFHNLGGNIDDLRHTAPVLTSDINTAPFIKRPIYYLINKSKSNKEGRGIFEWSPFYNNLCKKVVETKGCIKNLDEARDHLFWDAEQDYIVPVNTGDEDIVDRMQLLGYEVPKIFKPL